MSRKRRNETTEEREARIAAKAARKAARMAEMFAPDAVEARARKERERREAMSEAELDAEAEAEMAEEREAQAAAEAARERHAALIELAAEAAAETLEATGWSCTRDGSGLSRSLYVEAYHEETEAELKIRVSDHALPPTYGQTRGYADLEINVAFIDGDTDVYLPDDIDEAEAREAVAAAVTARARG